MSNIKPERYFTFNDSYDDSADHVTLQVRGINAMNQNSWIEFPIELDADDLDRIAAVFTAQARWLRDN